jgi:hypothetical protein
MNPSGVRHPICGHPRWYELTSGQQRALLALVVARDWRWSEERLGEVIDELFYFKPCPPAIDDIEAASDQQGETDSGWSSSDWANGDDR